MVKTLIPDAFAGPRTVEAVWRNRVRFAALDRRGPADAHPPRTRPSCASSTRAIRPARRTCVITYAKGGQLFACARAAVVMAGGSWTTKHIVRDLPHEPSRRVRAVLSIAVSHGERRRAQLALPVRDGDVGLPLVRGARQLPLGAEDGHRRRCEPDDRAGFADGADASRCCSRSPGSRSASRERAGARSCSATSFAQYERAFREQLADMFAPGGFDPRRDIAGIILNRWGHAYVNPQPGFFFGVGRQARAARRAARPAARSHRLREHRSLRRDGSPQLDPRGGPRGEAARRHLTTDHHWRAAIALMWTHPEPRGRPHERHEQHTEHPSTLPKTPCATS